MREYYHTEVWESLNPSQRRRLGRALRSADANWHLYRTGAHVTIDSILAFARKNLLRGFFERPARIVTAIAAMQTENGIVLGIGLSPHPANVSLPAWGCSFLRAIKMSFGEVTEIIDETATKKE